MQAELEQLLVLQDRAQKIRQVEAELKSVPLERKSLDGQAAASSAHLEAVKDRARHLEMEKKRLELDVGTRKLELKVSDAELATRRAKWKQPEARYTRGYGALFARHITQADKGCDFDFLHAGSPTPDPEIH